MDILLRNIKKNSLLPRITFLAVVFLYCGNFIWSYSSWLSKSWGYFGFNYYPPTIIELIFLQVIAVFPALYTPVDLKKSSDIFIVFLYIFCYIPGIFLPFFILLDTKIEIYKFIFCLFFCYTTISLSNYIRPPCIRFKQISKKLFWQIVLLILVVLLAHVYWVFKDNIRLVGLDNVYTQRLGKASQDAEGTNVGYSLFILSGAIIPLIYSYSIVKKKYLISFVCIIILIFLYSTLANKTIILSIIIIPVIYFLIRKTTIFFSIKLFLLALIGTFILVNLVLLFKGSNSVYYSIFSIASSIVIMRTFTIQGLLFAQYYHFFSLFPNTRFSHIKVINKFIDYPFEKIIGKQIGQYYYTDLNANANFLAFDGISSLDLLGMIIMSIIFSIFLIVINSFSDRHSIKFTSIIYIFAIMNLCNASFFTALLTGGLGVLVLLLSVSPPIKEL